MVRSKFRSHMRCELASGSSHDGHNDGFYKAIGINGMLQGKKSKNMDFIFPMLYSILKTSSIPWNLFVKNAMFLYGTHFPFAEGS